MNTIFRKITFFLILSLSACVSSQSSMIAANGEDGDSGLGGTGMLASDDGNGLGGTGILGVITGYGSIFVNGIEIEYDNNTTFTLNGKIVAPQRLEIGDVVEVLTVDNRQHTQAQVINLRHEIIGVVESVEPETYSFMIREQSIVQSIDKTSLPKVGDTVAVAGFRIDKQTILSTRVRSAKTGQTLLRTSTELPFNKRVKRWLVQTYTQDNRTMIHHDGTSSTFELTGSADKSFKDRLNIKILQLQKRVKGKLVLKQVIEPTALPRGRRVLNPAPQQNGSAQGGSIMQKTGTGSKTAPNSGPASSMQRYFPPKGKQNGKP